MPGPSLAAALLRAPAPARLRASSRAARRRTARGLVWVLTRAALRHVAADPTALGVVRQGRIYEIVSGSPSLVPGVAAVPTEAFPSYASMAAAVARHHLVPRVRALLYDPERWSRTPLSEQRDVRAYLGKAVALARRHGLEILVTPGLDLVQELAPGPKKGRVARFLSSGVEAAAAGADVVDVQAQSMESDTAAYAGFVGGAAAQVHERHPAAIVIAGLSTNPPTGPVDAAELVAAIESVKGDVGGFWLNMPGRSTSCPGCSANVDWRAGTAAIDAVWG